MKKMRNLQRYLYMTLIVTSAWCEKLIFNVKRTTEETSPSSSSSLSTSVASRSVAPCPNRNGKYRSEKTTDLNVNCLSPPSVFDNVPTGKLSALIPAANNLTTPLSSHIISPMIIGDNSGRKLLEAVTAVSETDCFDYNCTIMKMTTSDNNETHWNDSYEDYLNQIEEFIFPRTWTWILIFIHSFVFVIGLVGNTLVCVAVYRNHTMRTVTNYFIVNLAVADFMVILFCLPPTLIWDVTMTWFFGVTMCKVVLYLQTVSVTVSVLTLTFISIDRWYAICFPLKFKSTTGRAKTAIFIIWLVALLFDIPELIVYRTRKLDNLQIDTIYFTQCSTSWSRRADASWTLLKMLLLYGVPLTFMSATYCQIVRVLWRSGGGVHQPLGATTGNNRSVTSFPNTNVNLEGQLRSRKKAAKMLVAVVVMFAVCYFPVHLLSTLRIIINLTNSDMNRALSLISHWLCYANSAINPIIYNFMSGKFRKEFRRAFDCCSPNEDRHGYEMNSVVCCKNATRDTGLPSNYSRSFRRTNTRTWAQGRNFNDRRSTRSSLIKMDL